MVSTFHNPEDNNYHIWFIMALLSKQAGYSPYLSFFFFLSYGFWTMLNAVTKYNWEQNSLFEFTNADIKYSEFLSMQVRVNKELIFNPSHAAYKPEDEAVKKKSFLSFWIALTWNLTKGRGKIINKLTLNLCFLEGTISLLFHLTILQCLKGKYIKMWMCLRK